MDLQWTPRLESTFRRLLDTTTGATDATSTTLQEQRTLRDVKTLLESSPVCVSMELIMQVSAMLLRNRREEGNEDCSEYWIHSMIRGSSVYIPKQPPKERSPELERIMDRIKAEVAEKEYQRMVSSINGNAGGPVSIGSSLKQDMKEMQEVKAHLTGIINVLYTGGAVFMAVFMLSAHFTEDLGMRVLLAFLAFVLIVACEAYLYTRHAAIASENPMAKKTKYVPGDVVVATKTLPTKEKAP
ncbi:TMEM199 family protein [Entomortierella parvispora]|uniref:TMEM199 family protein n=1 Tax=Entomortierella parvispora TaxID=205924 RepID=A0A9P3HE78_9FUNG|nr:TMEM199 family protein [Entomortierella parvispora]